jgi:hypothetical protein
MQAIGSSLLAVGVIGIAFELFNRRASEEALFVQAEEAAERTQEKIASQTVAAVVGDPTFVREVLTDERRKDYLQAIILANLDGTARLLAERTAAQFSGRRVLREFDVTYVARDQPRQPGELPRAELVTTLISNERPADSFRFRFVVIDDDHDTAIVREPDVFTWTYRRLSDEKMEDVLQQFGVKKVSVNGVDADLSGLTTEPGASNEKRLSLPVETGPSGEYQQEVHLLLPPPRQGSYVFFQPGQLTRGIEIRCDYNESAFVAVVVEALQTDNVREVSFPVAPPHTVKGFKSADWVLPSASVAFVFYERAQAPGPLAADLPSPKPIPPDES